MMLTSICLFSDVYRNPLTSTKNFLVYAGNKPNTPSGVAWSTSMNVGTPKKGKMNGASSVENNTDSTILIFCRALICCHQTLKCFFFVLTLFRHVTEDETYEASPYQRQKFRCKKSHRCLHCDKTLFHFKQGSLMCIYLQASFVPKQ
jgi:hypothetical protein